LKEPANKKKQPHVMSFEMLRLIEDAKGFLLILCLKNNTFQRASSPYGMKYGTSAPNANAFSVF
jgi:hypothetical protein